MSGWVCLPLTKSIRCCMLTAWRRVHAQVNPQFYAFRWITLLLTQEFSCPDVTRLWDTMLSDPAGRTDSLLRLCMAMLLNLRQELLQARPDALQHLSRCCSRCAALHAASLHATMVPASGKLGIVMGRILIRLRKKPDLGTSPSVSGLTACICAAAAGRFCAKSEAAAALSLCGRADHPCTCCAAQLIC